MKSYILAPISSEQTAADILGSLLPGQGDPWLLMDAAGDAMAYFTVGPTDVPPIVPSVSADISGRHYNCDKDVLSILQKLRDNVGGDITYAP